MRIILADDHEIVRRGLQLIFQQRRGWSVVAEAASAEELLDLLPATPADVLVLDVSLGTRNGIDLLPHIRTILPALPVLMLSMHPEEHYAIRAIRAGANGYAQKDQSPETLLQAIERVSSGRFYASEAVLEQMAATVAGTHVERPDEQLSRREFEVFRLIARGQSVGEIAAALNVSVKTVSTYRTRILEKTGFRTNADIIAYAIRNELV